MNLLREAPSRAVMVGGAGGVWGLGLGRLLAEAAFWSVPYRSPAMVSFLAAVGVVVALALWRWSSRVHSALAEPPWSTVVPLALPLPYVLGLASRPLAGGALLVGGAGLTLLMVWRERPSWALPALLGLVTLGIYLRTLLPSVGEADTFEFQVVVPQLGVAHPTGYPLYVLLGKLFTLLPLQGVAWRLNLASAIFALGAVLFLYDVSRRLTGNALSSFLVALAFAFSGTFWSQAVVAEVYTLHNLLVAAVLWLLFLPREKQERQASPEGRWLKWVLFVLGLSLTNHLTTALLVPAVLLALLVPWRGDHPRMRAKDWAAAIALFALGLSPYLFIPLRWPTLHDGTWMTLRDFLTYVTGGQFRGALQLDGWQDLTRWRIVARLMLEPFGWAGLGLAAVGALGWAVRRRRALMVTGVACLAYFAYGLAYQVADIAVFLIPAHLILAIWMGAGVALLLGSLSSFSSRAPCADSRPLRLLERVVARVVGARAFQVGLITLLTLIPLGNLWTNLPMVDRSGDREGYVWGQYALQQPLAEGGAVLADPKRFAPLYYLQQIEGVRPDLEMVLLGTEELYQADLRRRLGEGQIVYLARYLPHLDDLYLRSVGPLAEVGTSPQGPTEPDAASHAGVWGPIQLLDAEVERDPLGRILYHVTLHWQAEASVDGDLAIRLQLVNADGEAAWVMDGARPVNELYPTNAWRADVPVSDYHAVPIEPWLPPGEYSLQVGLFPRFGDEEMASDEGATPWLQIGTVAVGPPDEPESLPQEHLISLEDGSWLTGSDIPGEATAGAPLTIDLGWRRVAEEKGFELWWTDGDGKGDPSSQSSEAAGDEAFSFRLPAGMVRSRHTITAPREAGVHMLRVGPAGETARCGWLGSPQSSCTLFRVQIVADQEGLASFEGRVLLVEATVGTREANRGEVIPVDLRWRGLRTMEENYTVFVHLVGPDGRLHGQVDSWPVQGTYPTGQWRPGQEVSDPYEVRLAPDAPGGAYRVEVGLYLLETMERLRVLNEAGKPVGDSFVVGTFEVR